MDERDYGKTLAKLEIGKRGILVCNDISEDEGSSCYMSKAMKVLCSSSVLQEDIKQSELEYMERYTNQTIIDQ